MSGATWPIVLPARLERGVLKVNAKHLAALLAGRRDADVSIVIERKHATRSLSANKYYWGVIVAMLSEHTGYTADELHELLKAKFIPKRLAVCDQNGEVCGEFVIGGTTTRLNQQQFSEYCEAIRRWAAETLSVVIPDPGQERAA